VFHVCAVRGYCRLSSQCSLFSSTPVAKFVLLSTKLALQNKYFSAQNAVKFTSGHLGFQKIFRGLHPDPLEWKGEGRRGKAPQCHPRNKLNPGYACHPFSRFCTRVAQIWCDCGVIIDAWLVLYSQLWCSLKLRPHQQQCRSNIVECGKSNVSFDKVEYCFDKVERCFDIGAVFLQQCRTKFRPFDKVETKWTCSTCFDFVEKRNFTKNSFDIVAVFGNKVECCFDKVELVSWSSTSPFSTNMAISETKSNVASTLLLVWTGLKSPKGGESWIVTAVRNSEAYLINEH